MHWWLRGRVWDATAMQRSIAEHKLMLQNAYADVLASLPAGMPAANGADFGEDAGNEP